LLIEKRNKDKQNIQKSSLDLANKIVAIIASIIIKVEKTLTNILFKLTYKLNIYNYSIVQLSLLTCINLLIFESKK